MGKSRKPKSDSDLKEIQLLKIENRELKKTISSLRKQLSRIDIDSFASLKDHLEAQERKNNKQKIKSKIEKLKEEWICHQCSRDYLKVVLVPKGGDLWYFRRCTTCSNKTKLKIYTPGVEGINTNGEIIKADLGESET